MNIKTKRILYSGLTAMKEDLMQLPLLYPPGASKQRFSSADGTGGNGREFLAWFSKYIEENGEYVFFDAIGPGCLYRQHMNIWRGIASGEDAEKIRIRYYFDNEDKPRIDSQITELFDGLSSDFPDPFAFKFEDMFGILYYPFAFKERLKVSIYLEDPSIVIERSDDVIYDTLEGPLEFGPMRLLRNWHQYDYLSLPDDTKIESWRPNVDNFEVVAKQWEAMGQDVRELNAQLYRKKMICIKENESGSLYSSATAGSVLSIAFQVESYSADICDNCSIKFRWDDLDQATCEIPLGFFFGGGNSIDGVWNTKLDSLLYGFNAETGAFYCYWPMLFWEKASIEIINATQSDVVLKNISISYTDSIQYSQEKSGYFMARITKNKMKNYTADIGMGPEDTARQGELGKQPYAIAFEERGSGHVVGINMWSSGFQVDGSEYTFIDDIKSPIRGTGTEDDFNQGFSGDTLQKPLWGSLINGASGVYRIHLNAPYIYNKSIKIHFNYSIYGCKFKLREGLTQEDIHSEFLVFYYKSSAQDKLILTDTVNIGDEVSEKQHHYDTDANSVRLKYEGHYTRYWLAKSPELIKDCGIIPSSFSQFNVSINKDNAGIKLRRRIYVKEHGFQRSYVYVDGVKIQRIWQIVTNSGPETYQRSTREECRELDIWYDSDFEIPKKYTAGKTCVTIKVTPVLSKETNEFFYWVYSYKS